MQIHAEVAKGALEDAGLEKDDIDGLASAGKPPAANNIFPPQYVADYLGLEPAFFDTTDSGGSAYLSHVGHAVNAIRNDKCDVVLVTLGGRPRSGGSAPVDEGITLTASQDSFERIYGTSVIAAYAMAARRHMHEYGTTSEQLAEIRVAASHHAQYNENALYQDPVTVEDVVSSKTIADPLHLLDCCVVTDGGGAVLVVSEDVAADLDRECVEVLGHGEATGHHDAGRLDITGSAGSESGRRAYEEAGIGPDDVDYVSIYDSFTITVLETLEDLGFCEKGAGGEFVEGGTLMAPDGDLPFNTDGGGQCSNHPSNRGGMTKIIEAVRQLRGEANPEVQVPDADLALAHGTGGRISTRHGSETLVLGGAGR
jgi:acetyl-CoA C-acetyltransferase